MATARIGPGCTLKIGETISPYNPQIVGLCGEIGIQSSFGIHDTTSQESTSFRQKAAGLIDAKATFQLFYDAADSIHRDLLDFHQNREKRYVEIYHPNHSPAKYEKCMALLSQFDRSLPVDGVVTASCTLEIDGLLDQV